MKKRGRVLSLFVAAALAVGSVSGTALAEAADRPADGTTQEQPFWSGTGGSNTFRIPCLVSLNDGTLVAGCDARWTTFADGGGLDTIVSYSKDKGDNWNYTFANYLGDNGNVWNAASTAFIDPAMATDGETVYLIADLYPAGYALNGAKKQPSPGKSHDEHDRILLADVRNWDDVWGAERTNPSNYTYYLEKNTEQNAESAYLIKDKDGRTVEEYTVDAYFNVKGSGTEANLFEADSPFQVWPTDYLYLTYSEDGGKTWSVPSIPNLRRESEQSLLVGPGRGMVTSTGRIIFTAYEFTSGDRNSAVIYSDDQGKTWKRGASVSDRSSEAVATEADGRLYMFTRHGGYYVSENFGETWSAKQNMGISYNLGCQLTAVTYPQKIDGKTAILFAAPSNTGSRAAGKIFTGLVQDDGSIQWAYEYSINGSAYYAYSCLTILPDGTVGLLYENADTQLTYKNLDIEDIAKGAAIGNIWCTDDTGKTVADVTMATSQSRVFTVNGLEDGVEVTASSDNDRVVEVSYADGKLTLTSKAVSGLQRAVVTVNAGGASAKIRVNVTDSENYEIVDLRIGDTKVYVDDTGNYADSSMDGLDQNIAEVVLKGEDPQSVETQVKAQLATAQADFNGDKKSLDSCMFTFDAVSGKANTYQIWAQPGDTKVYVNHKTAPSKCVCTTTATEILLEQKADGTVALKDMTAGANGSYLYFWKADASKLHFDRNSSADVNCQLELWKKAGNAGGASELPGYEKVTEISQITSGGQYLIAAKANDGAYYVVNPSSGSNNFEHAAKVIKEQTEAKPEAAVQLGNDAQYNGAIKRISECLFTFDRQDDGRYVISSTTPDGQTVYLTPKMASSASAPLTTTNAAIEVTKGTEGFNFTQTEGGTKGGILFFWKDNTSKLHFDRNSSVDAGGRCDFDIYKQTEAVTASEIAGYVKINDLEEITDNGQYLIVAKADNGNNYLLNPAQGNDAYSYVAKVTGDMYETETTASKTEITITGKAEGQTAVTIGNISYYIFVENDVKEVTLKVGDTYNVPGKIVREAGDTSIIAKQERTDMPPYKAISAVTEGTYLFGNDTHIMLNSASTASGNPNGLGMTAANFNTGEYSAFMWTLKKAGNGYTMQDVNGKYVNISGQNVVLTDTPQTLVIGASKNGGFAVSDGSAYLNNWSGANNKVGAYASDDNAWYFYKASEGNVVTAKAAGEVTLVTEGTTYKMTIQEEVQPCEHIFGDWEVTKEPTCAETGTEVRICTKCGETEQRDIAATGKHETELQNAKEATCTESGYTGDKICKVCKDVIETGKTINALGHDFTEWTVEKEATETESGLEVRTCQREGCGEEERREIPKLPEVPEKVDKSALEKYYNECLAYYKEADYTADSWKVYQDALDFAKTVLENEDATVQDVNDAIETIKNAAEDLERIGDVTDPGDNNNGNDNNGSGNNNGSGKPDSNKPDGDKPVKTGDPTPVIPIAIGMAGSLGVAIEVIRRKLKK